MPVCGLYEEGINGKQLGSTSVCLKGWESWSSAFPKISSYLF